MPISLMSAGGDAGCVGGIGLGDPFARRVFATAVAHMACEKPGLALCIVDINRPDGIQLGPNLWPGRAVFVNVVGT